MRLSPRHWSPKSGAQSTGWARGTTRELLETGLRSAGGGRVQPRAGHEAGRAAFLCHSCIFHFLCQSPFKRAETLPHRTQRPCLLTQLPPCERSRQLLWHVRMCVGHPPAHTRPPSPHIMSSVSVPAIRCSAGGWLAQSSRPHWLSLSPSISAPSSAPRCPASVTPPTLPRPMSSGANPHHMGNGQQGS